MREMKDSGIEYIGSVPDDWKIKRLKYVLNERNFRSETGSEMLLSVSQYLGVVPSDTIQRTMQANSLVGYKKVYPKDLVFNKLNPVLARFGVSDYAGITSPDFAVYYTDIADTRFLCYLLRTDSYITEYGRICTGVGDGFSRLYTPMLYNISVALPLHVQQVKIANFLDSKCAEIDALSADIQSEIDTLEAYKRSVITEAVTKGLDKNVPMKDSGIEWVGEIPANWIMQRGKYVFEQKSDRGNSKSLVLLSPTQNFGVIPQDLYEELSGFSAVKLNEKTDLNSLKTVHKGAFVISLRSFQGGFEYSEYEGVVSPAYQVFYPTIPVCDSYYKYLFKTQIFIDKMNSYTMSLRDGKNIAFADFGRTYIPIPPVDEQTRIANYLDDICSQLNDVIAQKQEQLAVLADYKKSVIYEYVTGKKEVPVA